MKQSLKTRMLSMAMAVIMMIGLLPAAVIAADSSFVSETHDVISRTTSTIAPGVTQDIVYAYAKDGKQMVYYVATADINRDDVLVQSSYKDAQCTEFGMAKLTEQMAAAKEKYSDPSNAEFIDEYYTPVAGVNGDFYNMTTGQPSGAFVMNGVMSSNKSNNRPWFAIFADGMALCGTNNTDWDAAVAEHGAVQQAVGGSQVLVRDGADVTATASGSYNTDRHSRTCVGVTADGKVVVMTLDGRQEPFSCGGTMHELAQIMLEAGCVSAINLDGGGSSTFAARQEGEDEVTIVNRPSDGSERSISSGLIIASTTAPSNVFDRAVLDAENDYVTPGSTVTVTATGVSPAGTSAEIPENAQWQLADSTLGTVENGVFVSSGVTGDAMVQMTVDGTVVGETTIHVVIPEMLSFDQTEMVVPYGKTVPLGMTATYGLNEVVLKDGDVDFVLSDAAVGTISGFAFTSCQEDETVTGSTITATLVADTSVTCSATITLGKGSEVLQGFETGVLPSEYYISTGYPQYGPMGSKKDANGNYYYNGQNELGEIYIVDAQTGKVHDGSHALAVECDFSQPYETGYHLLNMSGLGLVAPANAQTIGMWLYLPELEELYTTSMRFVGTAADGTAVNSPWLWDNCEPYGWSNDGWRYVTMDISGYAQDITFNTIQFYICDRDNTDVGFKFSEHASVNGRFTYYIDSITVDFSSAVDDREPPVFSSVRYADSSMSDAAELKGQTVTSSTISFGAVVHEDTTKTNYTGLDESSVKAYIDGVAVDREIAGGIISVSDAVLADGVHTIRFEISDKMGNMSYVERQITINAGSDIPTVSIVPQDPDADKILIGSLYWVDLVATSAQNVEKATVTFDLNSVSQWELDHMVVTAGFEAVYTIDEVSNNATITVTKTGKVADAETVLVQIPIRTWESRLTEYEGYEAQTPEKLWSRKIIWPMDIKLSANYGSVTFTDGTTGSFSMAPVAVITELYGNYAELNANGDYSNKTSWHTHKATAVTDKAATCTEDGYTGRTYCDVCSSVVDWGTTIPATGHTYELTNGIMQCGCGELANGEIDGVTYVDGVVLQGWAEDSYYVDGVKLTGVQMVEGYYYDFGTDGVCEGQVKYSGLFFDGENYRFAVLGEPATGWRMISNEWYYFDVTTGVALEGEHSIDVDGVTVTFVFEENGRVSEEVWYTNADGNSYLYYGPDFYTRVWKDIDGKTYFFNWVGVAARGVYGVQDSPHMPEIFYLFDLDTCELVSIVGGFMTYGGNTYYYPTEGVNAIAYGLRQIEGYFYYFSTSSGAMRTGDYTVTAAASNGLLETNRTFHFDETYGYAVDPDGEPLTTLEQEITEDYPKFVEQDGYIYYYKSANALAFGLNQIDGYYYYFSTSSGAMRTGDYTVTAAASNGLLTENRTFHFDETNGYAVDANGDALTSLEKDEVVESYPKFVEKNGKTYYYKSANAMAFGLNQIDGKFYYFSTSTGEMRTGDYTVTAAASNGLLTENRTFHFDETDGYAVDANGDALTSLEKDEVVESYPKFVEKNGKTYYYKSANAMAFGLNQIDGKFYYFSTSTGEMRTGDYTVTAAASNGLLTENRTFHFDETNGYAVDANGDALTSLEEDEVVESYPKFVEKNGKTYYYKSANAMAFGLNQIDGKFYYFSTSTGEMRTGVYTVQPYASNGLLTKATTFTFDETYGYAVEANGEPLTSLT